MTTLAQRLAQLSGLPLGAHTVREHLQGIVARFSLPLVAPYTVAAVLLAYSGLPQGTHAVREHLAVERAVAEAPRYGGSGAKKRRDDPSVEEVLAQWDHLEDMRRLQAERRAGGDEALFTPDAGVTHDLQVTPESAPARSVPSVPAAPAAAPVSSHDQALLLMSVQMALELPARPAAARALTDEELALVALLLAEA